MVIEHGALGIEHWAIVISPPCPLFGFAVTWGGKTPLATLRERFQRTSWETRPTQWLPSCSAVSPCPPAPLLFPPYLPHPYSLFCEHSCCNPGGNWRHSCWNVCG